MAAAVPAFAAAGLWFVRRELRHAVPVLQPRFFRQRTFAAATACVMLGNLAFHTTMVALPLLLEGRSGWTTSTLGLALMVLFGSMSAVAPVGGRLAARLGRRFPSVGSRLVRARGHTAGPRRGDLGGGGQGRPLVACGLPSDGRCRQRPVWRGSADRRAGGPASSRGRRRRRRVFDLSVHRQHRRLQRMSGADLGAGTPRGGEPGVPPYRRGCRNIRTGGRKHAGPPVPAADAAATTGRAGRRLGGWMRDTDDAGRP